MLGDRPAAEHGLTKIPLHDVLHIDTVLHWQGFIEAQMVRQEVEIALRSIDIQQ